MLKEKELDEQDLSNFQNIIVNAKIKIQKNDMDLIMVEDNARNVVTTKNSFAYNNHEGVSGPTLYNFPFV
jgi:hypothetical protein